LQDSEQYYESCSPPKKFRASDSFVVEEEDVDARIKRLQKELQQLKESREVMMYFHFFEVMLTFLM